jgi:ribosomal protein S18 acetylase RimI-like enzyme
MAILIRPARESDAPRLVEFNCGIARETEDLELNLAKIVPGVAAVLADRTKGFYLVADDAGLAVGQLMVTYEWSDWRNGWIWWLQSVYVDAAYRRKGIFRQLYEALVAAANEAGNVAALRLYVEKHNARALATYQDLGMLQMPFDLYQQTFQDVRESP